MPMPIHELEAEVLALAAEDRARILEGLIKSFEPDSTTRKAWVAEALRREADVRAGRVALVPGNEALARVRARIA
jgi:putative addiction module component (TIGR02574 family)